MSDKTIPIALFHEAYSQSLGVEGAQKLISEAIREAKLNVREEYSREDALIICDFLKKKSGYIKIIAITLSSRIRLSQIGIK